MVSPMPSCSSTASAAVVATMPFDPSPASVKPKMQRVIALRGQLAVDRDQILHAADLRAEDDLVAAQAVPLGRFRRIQRAGDDGVHA